MAVLESPIIRSRGATGSAIVRTAVVAVAVGVALLLVPGRAGAQSRDAVPHDRVAGLDRYATAAVAARSFAPGVDVVYVATGRNFPDALTIGPVAARDGAPILLTNRYELPAATRVELERLTPSRIVVVGGSVVVSDAVVTELEGLTTGNVERLEGPDRFATAAAISAASFGPGVEVAYIATGLDFPDALGGGVAAARATAPMLLATPNELPDVTRDELTRLDPAAIVVLGGPVAIGDDVAGALADLTDGDVTRLWGADRYATAAAVSSDAFPAGASRAYIATGTNFPDALAGVPVAFADGAPLLLTPPDCAIEAMRSELARLAVDDVVVLGGEVAVSDTAASQTGCHRLDELAPPTFTVDTGLSPVTAPPGDAPDGQPRTVASIRDADGAQMDFVSDELVLQADQAQLDTVLVDLDAELLDTIDLSALDPDLDPIRVVRVDPSRGDPSGLVDRLRALDPGSRGAHTASSQDALGLLELAARQAQDGLVAGLNVLGSTTSVEDRDIAEAPTANSSVSSYSPNPFDWTYLNAGSVQDIGAAEAWRALAMAGDANPTDPADRIEVAVIDVGCASSTDLPPGSMGWDSNAYPDPNGSAVGTWHCTHVATTVAGLIDNGQQAAGTGGQVARVRMYPGALSGTAWMSSLVNAAVNDIPVANMSFSGEIVASASFVADPMEVVTLATWTQGVLNLAAAGNDHTDVDATDCFVVCWEKRIHWPCELAGVVCVGGLETDMTSEAISSSSSGSNYGNEDVGIYAPYRTYSGAAPDNTANQVRQINGTSFATPYVAGVAAMALAVDPSLSNADVRDLLYDTAAPATGRANRYVQADDLIFGLYGNAPPDLAIGTPNDGASRLAGREFLLSALTGNPDGLPLSVAWRLDGTPIATGRAASYTPPRDQLGTFTLSAEATDGPFTARDQITVTIENDPPEVTLVSPVSGSTYYESQRIVLRATTEDRNYPPDDVLPDSAITWTEVSSGDVLAHGHVAEIYGSDLGTGPHIIRVTVDDGYATDLANTGVGIDPDPAGNVPPSPQIDSPSAGEYFLPGDTVQFRGDATDPEDGTITGSDLVWTTTYDADRNGTIEPDETDILLGTGESVDAVLQQTAACNAIYDHTITLTATDSDGVSESDTVDVHVRLIC